MFEGSCETFVVLFISLFFLLDQLKAQFMMIIETLLQVTTDVLHFLNICVFVCNFLQVFISCTQCTLHVL